MTFLLVQKIMFYSFREDLNKFSSLESLKECTKEKKYCYKKASQLYNELLKTHLIEYRNFSFLKIRKGECQTQS